MGSDAVLHPRGPLPPGIYWRRRLFTFGAVVLVALVGWQACGSDGEPTAQVTPSPSPSPSAQPTGSASPSPTASAAPATFGPCRKADLVVNARADEQSYLGSQRPVLTIELVNKGSIGCRYDVGQANREIQVFSGNDRVWSSDDCSPGGDHNTLTLGPGSVASYSVTWSRKRSAPGCPAGTTPVAPGTYRVIGRFGDLRSIPDTFTMR